LEVVFHGNLFMALLIPRVAGKLDGGR